MIIHDNVLPNPRKYRSEVLMSEFQSVDVAGETFHGISLPPRLAVILPKWIEDSYPGLMSTLSFFRKSPLGQIEPNFVHTDQGMGDWTAIFYLNENPPEEDGTDFWIHREKRMMASNPDWTGEEDWKRDVWELRKHVAAKFNRILMFPSKLFHSRAIYRNYGRGQDARLIQVVFGTGQLPEGVT